MFETNDSTLLQYSAAFESFSKNGKDNTKVVVKILSKHRGFLFVVSTFFLSFKLLKLKSRLGNFAEDNKEVRVAHLLVQFLLPYNHSLYASTIPYSTPLFIFFHEALFSINSIILIIKDTSAF